MLPLDLVPSLRDDRTLQERDLGHLKRVEAELARGVGVEPAPRLDLANDATEPRLVGAVGPSAQRAIGCELGRGGAVQVAGRVPAPDDPSREPQTDEEAVEDKVELVRVLLPSVVAGPVRTHRQSLLACRQADAEVARIGVRTMSVCAISMAAAQADAQLSEMKRARAGKLRRLSAWTLPSNTARYRRSAAALRRRAHVDLLGPTRRETVQDAGQERGEVCDVSGGRR